MNAAALVLAMLLSFVTSAPPAAVDYMLTSPNIQLAGSRVKAAGRFVLYRISRPLRLSVGTEGLYADGWTGPDATYTRYVPGARRIRVDLSRIGWVGPDVPGGPNGTTLQDYCMLNSQTAWAFVYNTRNVKPEDFDQFLKFIMEQAEASYADWPLAA